ncbi:MAG: hypothetical protein OXI15_19805 [Chromatiales bacterium]|nr:hypothetical protein [Chromatiales bacterium]
MTVDHFNALDTARDLEAAGIERPHAEAIARAVGRAVAPLATKADIRRLETTLRGDLEQHRDSTKADSERLETTLRGDFERRMDRHEAWTRTELANLRADMYRALWIQGAGIIAVVAALKLLP